MTKRILQFDGLRLIAVMAVIIGHWDQWRWPNKFLRELPLAHGVLLFFVLSGFLITKGLLSARENQIDKKKSTILKHFWIRRFLRIVPIYYLTILAFFLVGDPNVSKLFPYLGSFTTNVYQVANEKYIGFFNHFWSLSVEIHFYLFWPLLFLFVKRKKLQLIIFSAIALSLIARISFFSAGVTWMASSYLTVSCLATFAIGSFVAYGRHQNAKWSQRFSQMKWMILAIVVYVTLYILHYLFDWVWYEQIFEDFMFSVVAGLIVLRASVNGFTGPVKWFLELPIVTYLGKISYGIYIFHLFMPEVCVYITDNLGMHIGSKYPLQLLSLLVTIGLSHLSWIIIERPVIHWSRRLTK